MKFKVYTSEPKYGHHKQTDRHPLKTTSPVKFLNLPLASLLFINMFKIS